MDPYMKGDNVWPRQLPDFEVKLSEYYRSLRTFGRIMARNIALSLGLDEGHFENLVTHPGCSALVAHYPPVQKGILNNGLDPHTDAERKLRLSTVDCLHNLQKKCALKY